MSRVPRLSRLLIHQWNTVDSNTRWNAVPVPLALALGRALGKAVVEQWKIEEAEEIAGRAQSPEIGFQIEDGGSALAGVAPSKVDGTKEMEEVRQKREKRTRERKLRGREEEDGDAEGLGEGESLGDGSEAMKVAVAIGESQQSPA
ncbi:hypothetical protein NLI96_g5995 [Meripilus lineatus]|uniref:Uncharacterized protein n=1 Tax=Meripilus lineatus TaxID=2056292 RepID=A0AAD5V2J0_9APHY|nr:hypothetical protein NLI96_g5995 [Physisporinus lineatus]